MGIIKNQEIETIDMHERNCKKNVSSSKIRPRITMIQYLLFLMYTQKRKQGLEQMLAQPCDIAAGFKTVKRWNQPRENVLCMTIIQKRKEENLTYASTLMNFEDTALYKTSQPQRCFQDSTHRPSCFLLFSFFETGSCASQDSLELMMYLGKTQNS